ncbi:hypothetical protein U9M48_011416, partial [Paspalum notatum var. saurae]
MARVLSPWPIFAATLLLVLASIKSSTASRTARPGCRDTCGNLTIPYPFGIGPGCYYRRQGFHVSCEDDGRAFILLHSRKGRLQVYSISLLSGQVRLSTLISYKCYYGKDNTTDGLTTSIHASEFFTISSKDNELTAIGCNTLALLRDYKRNKARTGCFSVCPEERRSVHPSDDAKCSGMGCCQTAIAPNLTSFNITFDESYRDSEVSGFNPCSYAFVAEQNWFRFQASYLEHEHSELTDKYRHGVPAVFDWVAGNQSCDEAAKNRSSYACTSNNSQCVNSPNATGYLCDCAHGFQGNPYLEDGCQGLIAASAGSGLLFSVLGVATITNKLKQRRTNNLRRKIFKRNHGLLLQQLISSNRGIADTLKIFSLEELEEATNKFDQNRILGSGGHGTVYKGILSDQSVVAIKKSKIVVQKEIDEFINEVIILSQTNHRNVVKLFGCCLETEVPLLVYEFISNGTLAYHLHGQSENALPWKERLRIALETARAIAYLHNAASILVPQNILLTDALIAKVSDFGASRSTSIDDTGILTAVQGTHGYLDPEYFYTSRLTEKSDVYSFGVILAELLTRVTPIFSPHPSEVTSLASQFSSLMRENRLWDILDPQIVEEGGPEDIEVVARLAQACLSLKGEERPTMRQVETTLEDVQASKVHPTPRIKSQNVLAYESYSGINGSEGTRLYSLEKEFIKSSEFP